MNNFSRSSFPLKVLVQHDTAAVRIFYLLHSLTSLLVVYAFFTFYFILQRYFKMVTTTPGQTSMELSSTTL